MKFVLSIVLLIAFGCVCFAGERYHKAKGEGAFAFAKAKAQCSCGDNCPCPATDATGQCATKPAASPLPEAPVQTGTVYSAGSCASGQCGSSSTPVFRFSRRGR